MRGESRRAIEATVAGMRILVIGVLAAGLVLSIARSAPKTFAGDSNSCTPPRVIPVAFPSNCSFTTDYVVAPGSSLVLTANGGFLIQEVDAGDGCTVLPDALNSADGSLSITLTCPQGLDAGSPISVTLVSGRHYGFTTTLTLTYAADTATPTVETVTLMSVLPPATVTYPPGWNLVAGPAGTVLSGTVGPLYTYEAGDTSYEVLPADTPLEAGIGYWAYFPSATSITLASTMTSDLTIPVPADQWVMVGNPFNFSAVVRGSPSADLTVEAWDPGSEQYMTVPPVPCCQLDAGRGAWVFSARGGTIEVTSGAGPP